MTRMSAEQLTRALNGNSDISAPGFTAKNGLGKHHAIPTEINGYRFKSKGEAERYASLLFFEKAGEIRELETQPKFVIQEGFELGGERILPIHYSADFRYIFQGQEWVEDWKRADRKTGDPYLTPEFRRTYKLFRKRYPEVKFWINAELLALPRTELCQPTE